MANPHFQDMILWAGNTDVTEQKKNQPLFMPYPSDQTFYGYFNDFMTYTATDWTITSTDGGGDSGEVIQATSSAGGALLITTNDADNDSEELQLKGEAFKLSTSKKAYFSTRFKLSDATESDMLIGLAITDTTAIDGVSDGVFFKKDDGDTNLDFVVEKDSTETATAAVGTVADDTFITATFFIDPDRAKVYYSINNAAPVGVANTNLPDNEELTVTIAVQAGAAAAKSLTVDYVSAIVER